MTQRDEKSWRDLCDQVISNRDPNNALDVFLALDRFVVELSMRIYNLPRRERFVLRKQNRLLHDAAREHLPRLQRPSRSAP